jgi:hypothetical protein
MSAVLTPTATVFKCQALRGPHLVEFWWKVPEERRRMSLLALQLECQRTDHRFRYNFLGPSLPSDERRGSAENDWPLRELES